MQNCWRDIKKRGRKTIIWLVKWAIPIIVLFGLLAPISFWYFRQKELPELSKILPNDLSVGINLNIIDEYTLWYYICLVAITAALAFIAWIQFRRLIGKLQADYLLEVDKRWHSTRIIKARVVIHTLFLQSKKHIRKHKSSPAILRGWLGEKIIKLSESQNKSKLKNFVYLLNFLDFMESVGYFYSRKYLTKKQVEELFGISLKFNYEIFKPYIEHRRKYENSDFYKEFENLYHDLCKIKKTDN